MTSKEEIQELVEKFLRIEQEKKLLAEDQKILFNEYKDRLDVKAVNAAIRIAKIKMSIENSEDSLEEILDAVESKITV